MGTATRSRTLRMVMETNGVAGIITEIRSEIGACRLCPSMKPFKKQPQGCFGTTTTGYMLVGEAPGHGPRPFDVLLGYGKDVRVTIDGEAFDHTPYLRYGVARFSIGSESAGGTNVAESGR